MGIVPRAQCAYSLTLQLCRDGAASYLDVPDAQGASGGRVTAAKKLLACGPN